MAWTISLTRICLARRRQCLRGAAPAAALAGSGRG